MQAKLLSSVFALSLFCAPALVQADVEHVVSKGHTVETIAHRYHVSVRAVLDRNHIGRRETLQPGEVLMIPIEGKTVAKTDKAEAKKVDAKNDSKADTKLDKQAEKEKRAAEKEAEKEKRAAEKKAEKDKLAKEKERLRKYTGRPETPGLIRVHRLGTSEDFAIKVSTRGKSGPDATKRFTQMMRSPAGVAHAIEPRLMSLLGVVSDHFAGRRLEVVSGYRPYSTKQYTQHSRHNHGRAVDFRIAGVPNEVVRDFCRSLRNTGCGYYPNSVFVHMDAREESAYWIDYSRPGEAPRYHGAGQKSADEGTSDVHADHDLSGQAPAETEESKAEPKEPDAPAASTEAPTAAPAQAQPAATTPGSGAVEIPKPSTQSPTP
jgi:uncharacterized protein YcbK (DUF882 family)